MTTSLLIVQLLNGLQFGILLFLVAAGLTLVFGVMDFINLAHGVQYMLGAYLAVTFVGLTGSFMLGLVLALAAALLLAAPGTAQPAAVTVGKTVEADDTTTMVHEVLVDATPAEVWAAISTATSSSNSSNGSARLPQFSGFASGRLPV